MLIPHNFGKDITYATKTIKIENTGAAIFLSLSAANLVQPTALDSLPPFPGFI